MNANASLLVVVCKLRNSCPYRNLEYRACVAVTLTLTYGGFRFFLLPESVPYQRTGKLGCSKKRKPK